MLDEKITLFLADDHQIVVEGIMSLVAQDPSIQVVGHCNNGLEVLDKVQAALPDVLVLDISMPGLNGLEICRLVKVKVPKTVVMMLTMHANEQCIVDAMEHGATGYLIKETASSEFCEAVHVVARGEVYLGQGIPRTILNRIHINHDDPDPYETLTAQERQVVQLLAEGKSNRQIGEKLQVNSGAVEAVCVDIMQKLDIKNQTDLIKYAIRRWIVTVDT